MQQQNYTLTDSDYQAALSFVRSQLAHVERRVNVDEEFRVPVVYPNLIPVDTSADMLADTILFTSERNVGNADFVNGNSQDIPTVNAELTESREEIHMAGLGYTVGTWEALRARRQGTNLSTDKASSCRIGAERFIDTWALKGNAQKNAGGLFNYTGITETQFRPGNRADGSGQTSDIQLMKPEDILAGMNAILSGVNLGTLGIEMCDTIIMSLADYNFIVSAIIPDTGGTTVLEFIKMKNIYTAQTQRELRITAHIDLDTIAPGGLRRMVAYRRSPDVLKLHIPMTHRFFTPVQQVLNIVVPGMFRVAPLSIRKPGAFRYALIG